MPQKQILEQTQTQTQVQTLTPQQLLAVRLLELPVADLENRVKNEIDENPALEPASGEEEGSDVALSGDDAAGEATGDADADGNYEHMDQYNADERANYASDDDIPDYLLNAPADRQTETRPMAPGQGESFYDKLTAQIGEHDLDDKQRSIVEYLIGSLDSDGLLRKPTYAISDELAIYHNIDATDEEIEKCIGVLQSFDPVGIGARSLQECLLLQLRDADNHSPYKDLEIKILTDNFDDFTHKRIERLARRYNMTEDDIRDVFRDLRHLNPRPGSALDDTVGQNQQQVVPDFIVTSNGNGGFDISLNKGDVPELHVSKSFVETYDAFVKNRHKMSKQDRDAFLYTKQRIDAAQNFINAIRQRHDTLLRTMRTIVEMQKPFFQEGDETLLRPMILRDVAGKVGVDVSTISRVSNSKYVETEFGVFPLKFFFNNSLTTAGGEEVSKIKVKSILRELIDNEDKNRPLSDETLVALLKEKGYDLARRTVAKYRAQMGIPVARLRK
jgi:RNA polymerase sigma-54 factor